jgi:hypothetical protein
MSLLRGDITLDEAKRKDTEILHKKIGFNSP